MFLKSEIKLAEFWVRLCFFAVFCAFSLIAFSPLTVEAQSGRFSAATGLPKKTLGALQNSARDFKSEGKRAKVAVSLPTKLGGVVANFEPHDIRSKKYHSQTISHYGISSDAPRVDLFSGKLNTGKSKDFARFSIIYDSKSGKETVKGFIRAHGDYYSVNALEDNNSVIEVTEVTDDEIDKLIASCGVAHDAMHFLEGQGASGSSSTQTSGSVGASSLKQLEVATDADYEFVTAKGSANNAKAEILSILNAVDGIYQSQLSLTISVTFQNAWATSSDPYSQSDAGALLTQFETYWQNNFRSNKTYDTAHLWTGRDLTGSTIGIAYVSAVCRSYSYGLSQYMNSSNSDVPLTAHEIGHNLGSGHDSCSSGEQFVMCPFLISGINNFSTASKSAIANYVGSVSCLTTVNNPSPPPSNNPPVLGAIGNKSVAEQQLLSFTVSASDPDGHSISLSASGVPSGASFSGGTFSWTPAYNVVTNGASSKNFSVTFVATDSQGATDSETITITVSNVNRSPVFGSIVAQNVNEGSLLSYQLPGSDPDSDTIRFSAPNGLPAGASLDLSSGVFTWKPGGDQAGSYAVAVRVTDSFNASANDTLNITVQNVNGIPSLPSSHRVGDLSGDGRADVVVYRPYQGRWFWSDSDANAPVSQIQFGLNGDVPMLGDYNGDNISDFAVFRPSNSTWYFRYSGSETVAARLFGTANDRPISGDFDGDGRTDLALFRPSSGLFVYLKSSDGITQVTQSLGNSQSLPVPCDYDGDGKTDFAVFGTNQVWTIKLSSGGTTTTTFGWLGDIPVPADYDGNGSCEIAVWRPFQGRFYIQGGAAKGIRFGQGGHTPLPADYNGNGSAMIASASPATPNIWSFRQSSSSTTEKSFGQSIDVYPLREWFYYAARNMGTGTQALNGVGNTASVFRKSTQILYSVGLTGLGASQAAAGPGSYVLRGDYDGDGTLDTAVYTGGIWVIYQSSAGLRIQFWGFAGDKPVAADFDGDGKTDVGIFRPDGGAGYAQWWIIRSRDNLLSFYDWGLPSDQPIPADFNGDGWADPAVWRESNGTWFVLDARAGAPIQVQQWGLPGDIPRVADFDGDGRADKVVWRPSTGFWYVNQSGSALVKAQQWGLPGDVPVPGTYHTPSAVDYAVFRPSNGVLYVLTTGGFPQVFASGLSVQDVVTGVAPYQPIP